LQIFFELRLTRVPLCSTSEISRRLERDVVQISLVITRGSGRDARLLLQPLFGFDSIAKHADVWNASELTQRLEHAAHAENGIVRRHDCGRPSWSCTMNDFRDAIDDVTNLLRRERRKGALRRIDQERVAMAIAGTQVEYGRDVLEREVHGRCDRNAPMRIVDGVDEWHDHMVAESVR